MKLLAAELSELILEHAREAVPKVLGQSGRCSDFRFVGLSILAILLAVLLHLGDGLSADSSVMAIL